METSRSTIYRLNQTNEVAIFTIYWHNGHRQCCLYRTKLRVQRVTTSSLCTKDFSLILHPKNKETCSTFFKQVVNLSCLYYTSHIFVFTNGLRKGFNFEWDNISGLCHFNNYLNDANINKIIDPLTMDYSSKGLSTVARAQVKTGSALHLAALEHLKLLSTIIRFINKQVVLY